MIVKALCRFLKTGDATEKDGCRKKKNEGHEGLFSTCYIFAILFVCHTVSLVLYQFLKQFLKQLLKWLLKRLLK